MREEFLATLFYFDGNVRRAVRLRDVPVWIGRATQCEIRTDHGNVSRKHAEVYLENGRYFVRDCHSDNGTWVNGIRITAPHALRDGDVLQCGDLELEYRERE